METEEERSARLENDAATKRLRLAMETDEERKVRPENESILYIINEKGDVGMVLRSTETREELSTNCNPKVMSRCLSATDATSLRHCFKRRSC